eukprot:CAMPEP_0194211634 /NCGR_PEP_ID=MMETSP0156-20130528/10773_1 /TAXON_ID=33649 /ORGANISM="Thalassionema nitzschioides, Strain L26-B" /LENGTH=85 /DNA_ID=CAMNT_0038939253 /DNA_START=84 /DNA_END=338 /DNA_ORIENTATION=+
MATEGPTSPKNHNSSASSSPELTIFVQDMLDQMNLKFTNMGDSIMGRMNEMSTRMDELEHSISDMMNQAGMESSAGSSKLDDQTK